METYFGYVKTPQDAIVLFEACRRSYLSRVQRRLSEKERAAVRSGSVFVWDEREAGMRRWTDGRTWSPSRVSGSFLTYRELDSKRRGSSSSSRGSVDASSDDTDSSESYANSSNAASAAVHSSSSSSSSSSSKPSFSYKADGLVKQSFSICTATHQKLHLICYYTKQDILNERLKTPIQDDKLKNIAIPKGMYPDTNTLETSGGAAAALHHMHGYDATPHPTVTRALPQTPTTRSAPGFVLPPQDIAWEKLRSSEDDRQLNAIYTAMKL
ncbi:Gti1/Pac2 family-domain-containing protein [Jimgerdemannia flammicorona]|uniref:Gti1/Pac2 family-domain-containing protein n=2 Tax=Jimgerdemannia flammicorona TaxID=994334 RepID=A0A433PF48_9FUNG|nr:Gti1/Pac2 family-domain-containing protein [Jimgerdemannia flammicorona]RUS16138.1 Gti1/Pac2 family-domain-containing protein [Jimgerdemannia flammicorona]